MKQPLPCGVPIRSTEFEENWLRADTDKVFYTVEVQAPKIAFSVHSSPLHVTITAQEQKGSLKANSLSRTPSMLVCLVSLRQMLIFSPFFFLGGHDFMNTHSTHKEPAALCPQLYTQCLQTKATIPGHCILILRPARGTGTPPTPIYQSSIKRRYQYPYYIHT